MYTAKNPLPPISDEIAYDVSDRATKNIESKPDWSNLNFLNTIYPRQAIYTPTPAPYTTWANIIYSIFHISTPPLVSIKVKQMTVSI